MREFMEDSQEFKIPEHVFNYETLRLMQLSYPKDMQTQKRPEYKHFKEKGVFHFGGQEYAIPGWAVKKVTSARISMRMGQIYPHKACSKFTVEEAKAFNKDFYSICREKCPERVIKPHRK
jgi:hypothetical protein